MISLLYINDVYCRTVPIEVVPISIEQNKNTGNEESEKTREGIKESFSAFIVFIWYSTVSIHFSLYFHLEFPLFFSSIAKSRGVERPQWALMYLFCFLTDSFSITLIALNTIYIHINNEVWRRSRYFLDARNCSGCSSLTPHAGERERRSIHCFNLDIVMIGKP